MKRGSVISLAEKFYALKEFEVSSIQNKGAYNFDSAIRDLKNIVAIVECIDFEKLELLSEDQLNQIKVKLVMYLSALGRAKEFNPLLEADPNLTFVAIQADLQEAHKLFSSQILPLISILQRSKEQEFEELRQRLIEELDNVAVLRNEAQKSLVENQDARDAAKRTVGEIGVAKEADHFEKEANFHSRKANGWAFLVIMLTIALFVYVLKSTGLIAENYEELTKVIKDDKSFVLVQLALTKILMFAIISYALLLSSKNFLSHKHNYIINKHRHNALKAFEALVKAAKNDDPRDIVLMHAAQCIFSQQDTGYLKQSGSGAPPQNLIEILPSLGSGNTGK